MYFCNWVTVIPVENKRYYYFYYYYNIIHSAMLNNFNGSLQLDINRFIGIFDCRSFLFLLNVFLAHMNVTPKTNHYLYTKR